MSPGAAQAVSSAVVISQVYGGGATQAGMYFVRREVNGRHFVRSVILVR